MIVKTWVKFEDEIDVDIDLDSVISALDGLPEEDRKGWINAALNSAHGVLKRISDDHIADMNDKQRKTIGEAILIQANRYLSPNA